MNFGLEHRRSRVLFTLVFATLVVLLFGSAFEATDDPFFLLLVSGFMTDGQPTSHLVFVHPYLGEALAFLYGNWLDVPWYSILLYVIQLATLYLNLGLISRFEPLSRNRWAAYLLTLPFFAFTLSHLSFTSTAFLLAFTAALRLFAGLATGRIRFGETASYVALFSAANWIRIYSSTYCALFLGGVVVIWIFAGYGRRLLPAGGCLIGFLGLEWVTRKLYYARLPEWQAYFDFNLLRGPLHDVRTLKQSILDEDVVAAAHWLPIDRDMFRNWFFTDQSVFTIEKLQDLYVSAAGNVHWRLPEAFDLTMQFLKTFHLQILMVGVAFLLLHSGRPKARYLATLTYALGGLLALSVLYKLPDRIAYAVFLFTILTGYALPVDTRRLHTKPRLWPWLVVAAIGLVNVQRLLQSRSEARSLQEETLEQFETFQRNFPGRIFLISGGGIQLAIKPFQDLTKLPRFRWIGLGWDTHSPDWDRAVDKLGLAPIEQKLARDRRLLWIATPVVVDVYRKYMQTHYGLEPAFKIVDAPGATYRGYYLYELE